MTHDTSESVRQMDCSFKVADGYEPIVSESVSFTNDKPVSAGEYVFTLDGDYVVYTLQDAAHLSNSFLVYVRNSHLKLLRFRCIRFSVERVAFLPQENCNINIILIQPKEK